MDALEFLRERKRMRISYEGCYGCPLWVGYYEPYPFEVHRAIVGVVKLIKEELGKVPAADVAPVVHGLWIPIRESEMTGWDPAVAGRDPIGGYICSACKEEAVYDCNDEFVLSKYCPNCGAKMDGGADNEAD